MNLTTIKEIIPVIRELIIIIVLAVFIFFPKQINRILTDAGFKNASIAGFNWEAQVQQASEKTGEARQQLTSFQTHVESLITQLKSIAESADNESSVETFGLKKKSMINQNNTTGNYHGISKRIGVLVTSLDSTLTTVKSTKNNLTASLNEQENILKNASPGGSFSSSRFGVKISSDKQRDKADYEVLRAHKAGYDDVKLYKHGEWIATVIEFSSRDEALATLPNVRQQLRQDSYIINLDDSWKELP